MMSLNPLLYVMILLPTALGLWLHRRIGPNRGTAMFVIGGFLLGAAVGIAVTHRLEERRHEREFDARIDRAIDQMACKATRDATVASFPTWGIDVYAMKDAAIMTSRRPLYQTVRLVDAQGKLVVAIELVGGTTSIVRDEDVSRARVAVLVDGTTVHRVPLLPNLRCQTVRWSDGDGNTHRGGT